MRARVLFVVLILVFTPATLRAGGPAFIAGTGYNSGVEGHPLLWANASVQYYTDQGDLSPILTNPQADAFVAAAITPWTSAAGVVITVTQAGHLAEDVNGSDIDAIDGVVTAPSDVTPSATGTPLGIIYDYDGTVTDALLGEGAGDLEDCFTNAVYGGPDNFSAAGDIVHALTVINGVCATSSTQLPDVQYRLVRVLGRILGLGWSQANINVLTHNPAPALADYQGFPLMHFADPINCVPITICYGGNDGINVAAPKLDDVTAFAALYPAPGGNPQPTGEIWGNVYFTDGSGNPAQMMQGVNVVARLMVGGQPSRQYVVASVSGYSFVGNAGNIITGYLDENGFPFSRWGSSDPTIEGSYNLGQLVIPTGQTTAQYQLSVEALDPNWSTGVGPYAPTQVAPSGSFTPVVATVASGTISEQDILMLRSEVAQTHPASGSTYQSPVPLPQEGGWGSWISGYGSADFFEFTVQANRTASIAVTAFDESGEPTEAKLLPVIGIWELSDQSGGTAPASTPSAFNSLTFGMTRLDALFNVSEAFRVGIADYRGDGRPDYSYQASVLYSDSATPARLSMAGGVTTLQGIGFQQGLQVLAGSNAGTVLTQSANQMQVALPPTALDGTATIQVANPVNGSFSQMIGALTYGADATDLLFLLQGSEPLTPVGAQAANLIRVRATASDGVTPVNGATIAWSSTNGVQFSACGGTTFCFVLTDAAGEASSAVIATAAGAGTITAQLAPASYSPAQTVRTALVGESTSIDLAALSPTRWIAQGATLSVPLTVEALNQGAPSANVSLQFTLTLGTASLSATTATTNGSGFAGISAQVSSLNSTVQVSACVTPANSPCQTFTLFAVAPSSWVLEPVSGTAQVVPYGQPFLPLVMRVTDGSPQDNPVMGVNFTFVTTLERNDFVGQAVPPNDGAPIILGTSQTQGITGQDGLASVMPTVGTLGPCDAFIAITAGMLNAQFELQNVDALIAEQQPPPQKNVGVQYPRSLVQPGGTMALPLQANAPPVLFVIPQVLLTDPQSNDSSTDVGTSDAAPVDPTPGNAAPDDAAPAVPVPSPPVSNKSVANNAVSNDCTGVRSPDAACKPAPSAKSGPADHATPDDQ
ncbi:MAG: Ig-like domain-containing protein [Terriglobales bacterium]